MDVKFLFKKRRSVRSFSNKTVDEDVIKKIVETSKLAPSAVNLQPWKIYFVTNGVTRDLINKAYPKKWFSEAPVIGVFTGLTKNNWVRKDGRDYLMCDVTILADYYALAATAEGLGTCYVAAFDEGKVKKALNLNEEDPILLMPTGYPAEEEIPEKNRKDYEEIIEWI